MHNPSQVSIASSALRPHRAAAMLLFLLLASGGTLHCFSQAASEAGPVLAKDQKKALNGPGRNAAKHCEGDTGKHRGETISGCLELATALRDQLHDPQDARKALERACALGSDAGCKNWGQDFMDAGDLTSARNAWSSPPCRAGSSCLSALFDSYANAKPVDLANAERVGLPVCDAGGDDEMCRKLWHLGSRANFASIVEAHSEQRQLRIADLTSKAEADDAAAASDDSEYERLDAQAQAQKGTPDGLGASLKALVYATSRNSEQKEAAAYREEIRQLKRQELQAHMPSANPWNQTQASAQ